MKRNGGVEVTFTDLGECMPCGKPPRDLDAIIATLILANDPNRDSPSRKWIIKKSFYEFAERRLSVTREGGQYGICASVSATSSERHAINGPRQEPNRFGRAVRRRRDPAYAVGRRRGAGAASEDKDCWARFSRCSKRWSRRIRCLSISASCAS